MMDEMGATGWVSGWVDGGRMKESGTWARLFGRMLGGPWVRGNMVT